MHLYPGRPSQLDLIIGLIQYIGYLPPYAVGRAVFNMTEATSEGWSKSSDDRAPVIRANLPLYLHSRCVQGKNALSTRTPSGLISARKLSAMALSACLVELYCADIAFATIPLLELINTICPATRPQHRQCGLRQYIGRRTFVRYCRSRSARSASCNDPRMCMPAFWMRMSRRLRSSLRWRTNSKRLESVEISAEWHVISVSKARAFDATISKALSRRPTK